MRFEIPSPPLKRLSNWLPNDGTTWNLWNSSVRSCARTLNVLNGWSMRFWTMHGT